MSSITENTVIGGERDSPARRLRGQIKTGTNFLWTSIQKYSSKNNRYSDWSKFHWDPDKNIYVESILMLVFINEDVSEVAAKY